MTPLEKNSLKKPSLNRVNQSTSSDILRKSNIYPIHNQINKQIIYNYESLRNIRNIRNKNLRKIIFSWISLRPKAFDEVCLKGTIFKLQSMKILNQLFVQIKSFLKFSEILRKKRAKP